MFMSENNGSPGAARTITVLLVEDECLIRMSLADYLLDKGFTVIEAANAAEALAAMNDPAHQIDLIFSDVRMPGDMDGFALAVWVRENYRSLPVILTSGDIGQANNARKAHAGEAFLPKPYELHAVADKITQVVGAVAA
jgi:CheY-like chemotaxis protein